MKKIYLYFFAAFSLVACGEELGSLSVGGVSLGGTGLPKPGGALPSPSEEENALEYIIWSNGLYSHTCDDNIMVSAYLLNNDTGEALLTSGIGTFVKDINENSPTNLTIVLTVKNNNLNPIYEYRNSCESPTQLKDQEKNIYEPMQDTSCVTTTDEYQMLMPYQTKTYNLKYQIPKEFQSWNLKYNNLYSVNQLSPIEQRKSCSTFSFDFSVQRM